MMFLDDVRASLIQEAKCSPNLLSDLAGLEEYIAESYNARAICELLQNADDAQATRFAIKYSSGSFLVANNGRIFDRSDFESLCRSAHSLKARGVSIGYRGIGFKSVLGIAGKICLFSGELEATFCRDRTTQEIPESFRVPLVRIPHPLLREEKSPIIGAVTDLRNAGFQTIFAFSNLKPNALQIELDGLDPTSLLFLRSIGEVVLERHEKVFIKAERQSIDAQSRLVRLRYQGCESLWKLVEHDSISIAFAVSTEGVQRLAEAEAVVYAFLPTLEMSGFPIKINGDISTDPSRTRVVLDDRTADCIEKVARLIVMLLERGMRSGARPEDVQLLKALVPYSDPRMVVFQRRSFKSDLLTAICRVAAGSFEKVYCRPPWLNPVDFKNITEKSQINVVPRELDDIEGLTGFLKYLGAREADLDDLSVGLESVAPSLVGGAEVVAHLTSRHATGQLETETVNKCWQIWPVCGTPKPFNKAKKADQPLESDFVDLVTEKSGGVEQLKRLLIDMTNIATAARMLPSEPPPTEARSTGDGGQSPVSVESSPALSNRVLNLKRWRSAEQQVLDLLLAGGCNAKDVSRQNIGYDIEGIEATGKEVCVEVKLIDYPGQPFTLTTNEEAVARLKGNAYAIALVRQTDTHLEVAFIRDPVSHLQLVRQCKQWVWECSDYTFNPERYRFER